jgi:hypothetical protein
MKLSQNKQCCLITRNTAEIGLTNEIPAIEPMKMYSLSGKIGLKLLIVREETAIRIVDV